VPLIDPTPRRVSACPVHFLWDGRGRGRTFVRSGFLGLLAGGMLATAGAVTAGRVALGCAFAAWLVGQALSARRA
jgi:hypothetical protein